MFHESEPQLKVVRQTATLPNLELGFICKIKMHATTIKIRAKIKDQQKENN
jgi:hypothetical protein